MPDSFYLPLAAGRFASTEHTSGPWDVRFQHGGPPAALLARAMEAESPAWPSTLARVTVEILGPIPVGELEVRSRLLRPGRSVDLVEAELVHGNRAVARAQGWRIRAAALELPMTPAQTAHDVPHRSPTTRPLHRPAGSAAT